MSIMVRKCAAFRPVATEAKVRRRRRNSDLK